jgi:hypothetical protein
MIRTLIFRRAGRNFGLLGKKGMNESSVAKSSAEAEFYYSCDDPDSPWFLSPHRFVSHYTVGSIGFDTLDGARPLNCL